MNALREWLDVVRPPASRSRLADALMGRRDVLNTSDPVENLRMNMPQEPARYGATLTNRQPDTVDGVRPMFGLPNEPVVSPQQEARTRMMVDALMGMSAGTRVTRARTPQTYPATTDLPRFKVEPVPGQTFDDWMERVYSPEVRGPDNITRHPSLMYRGVSDAELRAARDAGAFRPASGPALYVENDPSRYIGGGAYGAKRGGAILQFDVGGLPSTQIASQRVNSLVEDGVPEIPLDRLRRAWVWNADQGGHVMLSQEQLTELVRKYGFAGLTIGLSGANLPYVAQQPQQ